MSTTKTLKIGLSATERQTINDNAVAKASEMAQEYLDKAADTIVITDKKESVTYGWRFQISTDGQPQFVVITD